MYALLLQSSTAALLLVASHAARAATPAPSGVVLYEGRDFPVCRAIAAALRRMGPPIEPTDWAARLPPIRGVTQPTWTPVADAAGVPNDALPHPGLIYGPPEEATIPGVVIETPPAMGTDTSMTVDFHLVRRTMQDDGTGRFSGGGGHPGQMLGWSFEAVDLKLFPGVTHVHIGRNFISLAMVLSGWPAVVRQSPGHAWNP